MVFLSFNLSAAAEKPILPPALKIADKNTVKYMIEELQDKATHEAELRKQETKLRKQTEAELQLSRENEQKLQERIAELEALLATRS